MWMSMNKLSDIDTLDSVIVKCHLNGQIAHRMSFCNQYSCHMLILLAFTDSFVNLCILDSSAIDKALYPFFYDLLPVMVDELYCI